MIGLLQRVTEASVAIDGEIVAQIGTGLLVLVGVQKGDDEAKAERLYERLINYRVFEDDQGKMNLSLKEINGGLLLVPQFTLAADTKKGRRPGFSSAETPIIGQKRFEYLSRYAANHFQNVEAGVFGADMKISLINDGPVTFWLEV